MGGCVGLRSGDPTPSSCAASGSLTIRQRESPAECTPTHTLQNAAFRSVAFAKRHGRPSGFTAAGLGGLGPCFGDALQQEQIQALVYHQGRRTLTLFTHKAFV
ncbi:hypothetical protein ATANTOWER_009663 [Ataeniobius toweri]|uniref:Uncharacterized protein n=1 Tax=Ataeniobius toweri TaxID=208326 RepID=A0ABU7AIV9_9TELE|nr:hypothetical protein [Ataeniobius toweri]